MTSRLGRLSIESFFARPADVVAPDLLGSSVTCGGVTLSLTEVEAYAGLDDPASHSYRGPTPRNEVMFGPPARIYAYFVYGMHWAVNLVCRPDGEASACLLRAGRVVEGIDVAVARRGNRVVEQHLARGPGNFAAALGADATLTGTTLWDGPLRWRPRPADERPMVDVASGPRVGVSRAADVALRFWIDGDPTVSPYRRSTRALPDTVP